MKTYLLLAWALSQKCRKRLLASSSLSVHPHGTARFHWTNFDEILYLSCSRKSVKKIQVSLKSYRNDRYFNSDGRFSESQIISTNRYITKQIYCAKFHAARYQVDTRRQHMVSYAVREYIQRPAHGRRGR